MLSDPVVGLVSFANPFEFLKLGLNFEEGSRFMNKCLGVACIGWLAGSENEVFSLDLNWKPLLDISSRSLVPDASLSFGEADFGEDTSLKYILFVLKNNGEGVPSGMSS